MPENRASGSGRATGAIEPENKNPERGMAQPVIMDCRDKKGV